LDLLREFGFEIVEQGPNSMGLVALIVTNGLQVLGGLDKQKAMPILGEGIRY